MNLLKWVLQIICNEVSRSVKSKLNQDCEYFTGGSSLYIECCVRRPKDKLSDKASGEGTMELTGRLGDVMKESAHIAATFARSYLAQREPGNDFFNGAHLHVHVPEVREDYMPT